MRKIGIGVSVLAVFGMISACSEPLATPEKAGESVLEVRDAFVVQPASGRDITGGGLSVTVTGAPQTLVGARTDIAGTVELHTMAMEDGMMRMRKVENFPVSENEPLKLERGGNHLMLFALKEPLEVGDTVDLILSFEGADGSTQDVVTTAEIVPSGG